MNNILQILLLGLVQGAAELLPVSSSAHVIIAEKLMGLDPSAPAMTFLLVMLHTGTMVAVLVYFWKAWRDHYFSNARNLRQVALNVVLATLVTLVLGLALQFIIEKVFLKGGEKAEIETLFGRLPLIGLGLLSAGLLILWASGKDRRRNQRIRDVESRSAAVIGAVQGLCLPFRGFSRSGATISTGLLLGVTRRNAEEFSFALAVVLTPPVIAREWLRLLKANSGSAEPLHWGALLLPGLFGMVCSFVAGVGALWLLSRWLEQGKWSFFGYYCIIAALAVFGLAAAGL
ncbi:MAG TPA: undecaprenyl-diphosphate phosphatase [Chthoniobacterales bacterium]